MPISRFSNAVSLSGYSNEVYRDKPQYREAFMLEAQLLAKLEHPHIVPVHDYGSVDGYGFMVQRLITGGSLRSRIEDGALSFQESMVILRQLASALDYIHSQGIANGEITRSNILFDMWSNPYIVNFFYANLKLKEEMAFIGKYLAPERWQGEAPTPASDQYALGIVAYQMLANQKPFKGKGAELAHMHQHETPPKLQEFRPDVPAALNDVLLRALAKKPEDRYPTVMDFARDFEKAVSAAPQSLFVSYSRQDKDYAQSLTERLQYSGFNVWIDSQIEYGDAWFRDIEQAIKTCAAFVLVMTPDSYESEWVQKEILLAKRYKKPIFPLLLKGEEFGIVIELQFADVREGQMPDVEFHRRLRRTVFGDI
jgi:serine/threonine protein kinase